MTAIVPIFSTLPGIRRIRLALGTPSFLQLDAAADIKQDSATAATIESESITPPAESEIYIFCYSRDDTDQTHDSLVAGFATEAGFTRENHEGVNDGGGAVFRQSTWRAKTTASPGSGTIVLTCSANTFQRFMGGIAIENVHTQVDKINTSNATGTSISDTFSPAAETDDVAMMAGTSRGQVGGTLTWSDGLTQADNSPLEFGTTLTVALGYKVSPASTQTLSGLTNNQAHILQGVLVRGEA